MLTSYLGQHPRTPVRRWLLLGCALVLCGYVLYRTQGTLVLLSISLFTAYLLDPSIDRLERLGLSRTVAIFFLSIGMALSCLVVLVLIVPQLQRQASYLAGRAPHWGQWVYNHLAPALQDLEAPLSRYFGVTLDLESLRTYATRLWEWLLSHLPGVAQSLVSVFQTMFTGVANFIVGAVNIVLVPVLTFYLLRDFDIVSARFYAALPPPWRPVIADWLGEVDQAVGGFLRGQCTIALVLATVYATGLVLLGVPLGFLLGVLAGIANMVPYMSVVVGLVPTLVLFSLSETASLWGCLGILLLYVGGQMFEGLYLSPRIMGKETGLHPVVVMVAIMVGGTLGGFLGIVLAVPLTAVFQVVLRRWHQAWQATWPPEPSMGGDAKP